MLSSAVVLRFIKNWLPVLIWMGVIFAASGDLMAAKRTSRFIGPFLRWFNPEISDATVGTIQFVIRKTAHVGEYAILSLLLWRAFQNRRSKQDRAWHWSDANLAIVIASLYAITDELHQSFIPSRQGSAWDVLLDTCGAVIAMLALWRYGRWRNRW